ncbi:gliding motility-associated C-terminal domain-containing protein [Algibacter pectinivorans]|uniref:Gliding motility-associated C-terminal domain-containing protein n=1 Tax=Algibacter pectinivorans TaxID=870482 RepID=A0A1I1RJU3_9FLAO|nr:gliding motility-associated C-terminal domain-containing protein [Algibacter pectinivorans]SFD34605.1 gliding motility-associated C-terminal domain-containing protein [Algibacter pectinivorans]
MRKFTLFYIPVLFVFYFNDVMYSQIVISKPNLEFTQACASPSFNTYNVSFSFSPESELEASNQFIVELSDGLGSFSNATQVYISNAGVVTTSPVTFSFSVPTTTSGEAYRIRIKSTAPTSTSLSSNAFPAYFKLQDTPFSINNLLASGVYCSGGSYLLTIDNPGRSENDSPLQYSSLTFNWYKETSPTTSVFISEGNTLSVSEPGTFFAETNYGTCTSNSFSNRVTISEAASDSKSNISSSLGNPYCSTDGPTVLSAINANGYQWFKNGEAIEGATKQMLETNETAEYTVNIDLGSCMTSATINLDASQFSSSINLEDVNELDENESFLATVSTMTNDYEFSWFFNDVLIENATTNSYEVSEVGAYKVTVTQTVGCKSSTTYNFTAQSTFPSVEKIPNVISPNGDGANDTWIIPKAYANGTNTEVVIINAQGNIVLQTKNYQNNWPEKQIDFKDINPLYYYIITTANGKTKKGSITVLR